MTREMMISFHAVMALKDDQLATGAAFIRATAVPTIQSPIYSGTASASISPGDDLCWRVGIRESTSIPLPVWPGGEHCCVEREMNGVMRSRRHLVVLQHTQPRVSCSAGLRSHRPAGDGDRWMDSV